MSDTEPTVIMIPARYASTRFPGKPLVSLGGIPMIRRVFDTCVSSGIDTIVLTDDKRIADILPTENVYFDTAEYANGTERCSGAVRSDRFSKYKKIINVQGDMPDVTLDIIKSIDKALNLSNIVTVFTDLPEQEQNNPNTVKMIHSVEMLGRYKSLWFGRGFTGYGTHHLGVYGYRRSILENYINLPVTDEENLEKLEQLRWLKSGLDIYASSVIFDGMEINTPEDAELWNKKNSL